MAGEVGLPYRTAYCASKFAVTGFLESLRSEMKVRVHRALLLSQLTLCCSAQVLEQESKQRASFDITIVCPPTVDTNLRKNSLTTDSKVCAPCGRSV